ncbi:MAG TPA: S41 family peptidase [Clostridiales bacterium]|nr:S41 family peptidase [Clostridiales bacterium]
MNIKKKTVLAMIAAVILIAAAVFIFFIVSKKSDAQKSDFSKLSWTDAFSKLHGRISKEYAFTEWKGIEWQKLYEEYLEKIEAAQLKNDFEVYYTNLRKYLHEVPDGHVGMNNIREIDDKYIGGGFGLAAAKLDDGRIIITWVDESGPAWAAGIRTGAELIEWDGQPVTDAVVAVSTIFTSIPATEENLESKRLQYLVRAPISKQISIKFLNQKNSELQLVSITAYDDNKKSLTKNYPDSVVSDKLRNMIVGVEDPNPMPEAMVEKKTLNGNISYIKIWGEFDADLQETGKAQSTLELLRLAVQESIEEKSTGIILDLRNNLGGLDDMAADILGSFYSEKTFYEYQNVYNPATGERKIQPANPKTGSLALYIEPAKQCFNGRIIALINTKCVSSGEGIAMGIRNLPNGETLGFFGTNGSFGLSGAEAVMPGGLIVRWPSGQSLDENKNIQLDSRDGIGGVSPSIPIPMSFENAIRVSNGEDIELEEAIRILGVCSKILG